VWDSSGNEVIELVVKSVAVRERLPRSVLDQHFKAEIEPEHAVMMWLVDYVSILLN
jgi:hypothetical protein